MNEMLLIWDSPENVNSRLTDYLKKETNLTSLKIKISNIVLTDKEILHISSFIQEHNDIGLISLINCNISDKILLHLSKCFLNLKKLSRLILARNNIGEDLSLFNKICQNLSVINTLKFLDFTENKISSQSIASLKLVLHSLNQLKEIKLSRNMLNREIISIFINESNQIHAENSYNKFKISIKAAHIPKKHDEKQILANHSQLINNASNPKETIQKRNNNNTNLLNMNHQKNLAISRENSNIMMKPYSKEIVSLKTTDLDYNVIGKQLTQRNVNFEEEINIYQKTIEELKNVNKDLTLKYVKKEEEMIIILQEKELLEKKLIQLQTQIDEQMKNFELEYSEKISKTEEIIQVKEKQINESNTKIEELNEEIRNLKIKFDEFYNSQIENYQIKTNYMENQDPSNKNILAYYPNELGANIKNFNNSEMIQSYEMKLNDLKEKCNKEIIDLQAKSEKRENDLYEYISKLKEQNLNLKLKIRSDFDKFQRLGQRNLVQVIPQVNRMIEDFEKIFSEKQSETSKLIGKIIEKQKILSSIFLNIKNKFKNNNLQIIKNKDFIKKNVPINNLKGSKLLTQNVNRTPNPSTVEKNKVNNNLTTIKQEINNSASKLVHRNKQINKSEFPIQRINEENIRILNRTYHYQEQYSTLNSLNRLSIANSGGNHYLIDGQKNKFIGNTPINNSKSDYLGAQTSRSYQLYLNQNISVPSSKINSIALVNRTGGISSTSAIPPCQKLFYHSIYNKF